MQVFLLILLAVGVLAAPAPQAQEEKVIFTNHRLMGYVPTTNEEVDALLKLQQGEEEVDFWLEPGKGHLTTFRVAPENYQKVMKQLKASGIKPFTLHSDVQAMMEENDRNELLEASLQDQQPSPFITEDHTYYRTITQINSYLDGIKSRYPSQVTVGNLGLTSYEGRSIRYIELKSGGTKPAIFVECGIHAREWISPAVCLYFIDRVLHTYGSDSEATSMLGNFDWIIIPVANPDGYAYTFTTNRLWRKNRRPCSGSSSYGVDLNRNWDAYWNTAGVGSTCSSDTWPGASVFSEPETRAIRDFVLARSNRKAYISFHSYSQMLFVPYGYASNQEPANGAQHRSIGSSAVTAIRNTSGRTYQLGTPPQILYAASGGSYDWAKLKGGVEFAWTYELRPDQNDASTGFQLPANQIVPCSEEIWKSLVAITNGIQ